MKDLLRRILGASIYILALLGGLYFRQPIWLLVCTILFIVAIYEWSRLQDPSKKNQAILFSGIALFIYLEFGLFLADLAYGDAWNNLAILLGTAFYLFCALIFRKDIFPRKFIPGLFLYILPPFIFLYILGLAIPPTFLLMLFCIIWISDTFAYLGGKLFGRTKLMPSVSPGKTWEGAISGILASGISALIAARYLMELEKFSIWFSIGILVAIFGILGDLFESKIKRKHKIKDSGTLLPGHGGILDRMDSLLFALPIYYIFVTILNVHMK